MANQTAPTSELRLSRQDHYIEPLEAKAIVNRYSAVNQGGFFKTDTISNSIKQTTACTGIRFYFSTSNKKLVPVLVATIKVAVGKHDDLHNGYLAVSESLLIDQAPANQSILLDKAGANTMAYRKSSAFSDGIKGGLFGIEAITALLAQPGCIGIRFYIGQYATGKKTTVLFGVNNAGVDLTTYVCSQAEICPNFCSANNKLNTNF